jgi:adenine/guanine phosphoribosyltransferase-like PRPP-binding protein
MLRTCFVPGRGIAGRRVVLVDDVLTTGATFRAAAEAVEAGGGVVVGAVVLVLS